MMKSEGTAVKRTLVGLFAVVFAIGLLVGQAFSAEPLKIRVGIVKVPTEIMPAMFANKKILKNAGKSYKVEFIAFRGTSPMIPALAAKEIDLATLAFNSFATAINNAKLDLTIYVDNFQVGVPGYNSGQWGVLANSGINSIGDLRGKRFAVPAINTAVDMGMRAVMKKQGMVAGKDYHVVEVRFANTETFLREGKIDVGFFVPPFWAKAQRKGGLKEIFKMTDAFGGVIQFVLRIGRTEFLRANRSVLVDFLEDYLLALRDPKNRNESVRLSAKVNKLPEGAIKAWLLVTGKDYYRDLNGQIDADALQRNLDQMLDMGFSKKKIKVGDYWDSSYLEAALKRVGRQ